MKLLLWHCEFIEYKDKKRSTRPQELRAVRQSKTSARFSNVVAVFTCIESGDNQTHVNIAVKEILQNLKMIGLERDIVIVPFVHLSSKIARPKDAIRVINELIKSLREARMTVHESSFGYHKDFELCFKSYGHPGSVCFRSIPQEGGISNVSA